MISSRVSIVSVDCFFEDLMFVLILSVIWDLVRVIESGFLE